MIGTVYQIQIFTRINDYIYIYIYIYIYMISVTARKKNVTIKKYILSKF